MDWHPPDEVRFARPFPKSALFFWAIASALLVAGQWRRECIVFAAPVFCIGVWAWLYKPTSFTLRFHPDRIEHQPSGQSVRHEEIACIQMSDRCVIDAKAAAASEFLIIGHSGGIWRLPHHPQIERVALYRFLLARSRLLGVPAFLPGRLREAMDAEVADFGAEQVLASAGRPSIPGEFLVTRFFWIFGLVFAATGMAAAYMDDGTASATIMGIVSALMLFVAVAVSASRGTHMKTMQELRSAAGIVLSPRGLTLESADLKGTVLWAEIRSVTLINRGRPPRAGLLLRMDGAQIRINDLYACPLTEIYRRIQSCLSHEEQ